MRSEHRNWARVATAALLMASAAAGCGDVKDSVPEVRPVDSSALPTVVTPMPGQASVAGTVFDLQGQPVVGATVKVPETDGVATTDAQGAYALMVPSDSTVTLVTTATGFAPTTRESIVLSNQAMVTGLDVTMLSSEAFTRMNAPGPTNPATPVGMMAVRLHTMSPTCTLAGATVSVWPPKAATVVYSRPSTTGGLDEPDGTLTAVQEGCEVGVWLTSALLPGNMLQITVDKPGCTVMAQSPTLNGMQYSGMRRVDAQALTVADLFLN